MTNGGDVSYLKDEVALTDGQLSYLFVNANFGFGKFATYAIIADNE